MSERKGKRALVLGCGGVAGAAWTIATLAELERRLAWDAREADILVGTSSGALVAGLLGSGVSVTRMVKSQLGELADDCWNHDVDWGAPRPPKPELKPTAPALAYRALTGRIPPMMGLIGLVPRGRADLGSFVRLIDRVASPGQWASHPETWIMVVDANTGERVPLGRTGTPRMALSTAVCASYAIPGWCPPVTVSGRTYLDGGIASPTSADLLIGTGVTEAIVLAPMACRAVDAPRGKSRVAEQMRRHMTRIVNREVHLLEQAGIRVARLEPGAEDIAAIGSNMMNAKRRRRVFDAAVRTATDAVADALLSFHDGPGRLEAVGA